MLHETLLKKRLWRTTRAFNNLFFHEDQNQIPLYATASEETFDLKRSIAELREREIEIVQRVKIVQGDSYSDQFIRHFLTLIHDVELYLERGDALFELADKVILEFESAFPLGVASFLKLHPVERNELLERSDRYAGYRDLSRHVRFTLETDSVKKAWDPERYRELVELLDEFDGMLQIAEAKTSASIQNR